MYTLKGGQEEKAGRLISGFCSKSGQRKTVMDQSGSSLYKEEQMDQMDTGCVLEIVVGIAA